MIVLDTNVLSEMMKATPDPRVVAWFNKQAAHTLYTSTITVAEIGYGIEALADGKKKAALAQAFRKIVGLVAGPLPFDAGAALRYADLAASARRAGKGFPTPDGFIAAIASSRGFMVATRDTAPYLAGGVRVINPWD